MSNKQFIRKQDDLKSGIDALADAIALKISHNQIDELDDLLVRRHDLLAELITLHQTDEDRENLLEYLAALRERDYKLMRTLVERRDSVKDALLKIGKVNEYVR